MMAATPQTPEKRPCMRARCSNEKMSPIMMNASGISPPAPSPCSARNAISCPMFCACPHSTEPTRNSAMATMKTGLRPRTSDSLP